MINECHSYRFFAYNAALPFFKTNALNFKTACFVLQNRLF